MINISIYKQPHQDLDLCCFSFARYSQECFTQIYRALYGDAVFVPLEGAKTKTHLLTYATAFSGRHCKRNVKDSKFKCALVTK